MSVLVRIVGVMLAFVQVALTQVPPTAAGTVESSPPAETERAQPRGGSGLERMVWTVENQERIALLHVPDAAATAETPVVFAFHGHGGSARQASRSFAMHTHWPEAIVVYMEGLPTPGALTDPEGKRNGWQKREGLEGDRDLKFFDAVLATLKKEYKVDARRVYAMGHSNGGGFTYLLWQTRPDVFAAFAPSGAFTLRARSLAPKPAMHIAGKKDPLVKFEHQERTIEAIKKANGCAAKGEAWAEDCTIYSSKGSSSTAQEGDATPLVTLVHEGGHKYPAEAPALIVRFFKGQAKTAAKEVEASSTK